MSPAIAGMRLTASARPYWRQHAGLTIPIPSFALLTTKGASRLVRCDVGPCCLLRGAPLNSLDVIDSLPSVTLTARKGCEEPRAGHFSRAS
jgi:hypothetical protein